jgi:hypothetical protein
MTIEFKTIIFEHQNTEQRFMVHQNLPYTELLNSIKNTFDLPDNSVLTFCFPETNTFFLPLTTADFWTQYS